MDPEVIQQLAQLSPGDEEVTLIQSRLELLTQKKIICNFENFNFGMLETFTVEIDRNDNRRASSWTFTLAPNTMKGKGNSTFVYARVNDAANHHHHHHYNYNQDYYYSDVERSVVHYVEASILDKNGVRVGKTFKSDLSDYTSFAQMEIFEINKDTFDLPTISPCGDGCLAVEATLKILRKAPIEKKTIEKNGVGNEGGASGGGPPVVMKGKPKADFRRFLNSKEHSDVMITAKDGKQFHAHKLILRVGSKVFDAMFKSEMSESTTGTVKLDDMSAAAVNFLLTYIYCGDILPFSFNGKTVDGVFQEVHGSASQKKKSNGFQTPVAVAAEEVLYLASKYQLEEVLVFIDRSFRRLCSEENALELFELSKLYSLDCKELLAKFIMDRPSIMRKILEP